MTRQLFAVATLVLCTSGFASAESFNFTYAGTLGGANTASGIFQTTADGAGKYLITSITDGVFNGKPILSLIKPGKYQGNDNFLFSPADPSFLDYNGFSFKTAAGKLNLYQIGDSYGLTSTANVSDIRGTFDVTPLAATPEPGSLLLLGTGMLGMVGILRRKLAV